MTETQHLLTCLAEECAEVIQAVSKVLRFGIDGKYPDGLPNLDKVVLEMLDVQAVWDLLSYRGVTPSYPERHVHGVIASKQERVLYYMGRLTEQPAAEGDGDGN